MNRLARSVLRPGTMPLLGALLLASSCAPDQEPAASPAEPAASTRDATTAGEPDHVVSKDTATIGVTRPGDKIFESKYIQDGILVIPGAFFPQEAEDYVLPFLDQNPQLFRGKRVLEIGTGSGAISLYAALLGAAKVVSTDINPRAIECATRNAERLGVAERMEPRLVPPEDISAYSVIRPDEQFDVIISNPPYSLDLDATANTAVVDNGDLGLSIVRGFPEHLATGGVSLLLYRSLFYQLVMVKFAEHEGYDVTYQATDIITAWEAESLFNYYLPRFLESQGLDKRALWFDRESDKDLWGIQVDVPRRPLTPTQREPTPGMILIRHKT